MAIIWWVIYFCERPERPANPNLDWIHHATFLTLNFIIDFVTYEVIFGYQYSRLYSLYFVIANAALGEVYFLCGMII